jgi:hypothetical protein
MNKRDILELALRRRDEAEEADEPNRRRARNDMMFVIGEHWTPEDRAARAGRPTLTINGLPQFLRQVTGQIRTLNPAVRVVAADGAASKETAEVIEGLVRHIENESDASSVYEYAAECAAACSIGAFRIRTQWADGDTFDQEIVVERIADPLSVLFDPMARHPTRKDGKFAFIFDRMRVEEFRKVYPEAAVDDVPRELHAGNNATGHVWFAGDTVTIAEYYWIEEEARTIAALPDGRVIPNPPADLKRMMPDVRTRTRMVPKVFWAKISGADILEGPVEVPGRFIPVLAVTGEEWIIGEEAYRSSVVRFAKDPATVYNYAVSAMTEHIAQQPKAPYMVTPQQIAGLEPIWKRSHAENLPFLVYNPDPAAPPPQRIAPPVASQGFVQQVMMAAEDMKRTTGIYDASLGARSNETSGIAIARRQMEGQNSTSVYVDNMVKAIRHAGQIVVDMIPRVYDTMRAIRILTPEGEEKLVEINRVMASLAGEVVENDLTRGTYAVKIAVGPSHETKREAAASGMMDFLRAFPQAAAATADLVATAQDWPDADRFAERLRKVLPPGVLSPEDMTDEERQAAAQAQAARQEQQAVEGAMVQAKVQGESARAQKAGADAQKAALEVQARQMELAIQSGMLDRAIQQAVAQAIMGMQPMGMQT